MEAQILTVIRRLADDATKSSISIRDITETFTHCFGGDYERPATHRWVGHVVRRKLNLVTQKSHGVFVVPLSEKPKLLTLFERYGVTNEDAGALQMPSAQIAELLGEGRVDFGDLGDIGAATVGQ